MSKFLGFNKKSRSVTTVNDLTGEVHSYTNTIKENNGANFSHIFGLVLTLFLFIFILRVLSGNLNDFSFTEALNRLDNYDLNGGIPYLQKALFIQEPIAGEFTFYSFLNLLFPGFLAIANFGIFLVNSIIYILSFVTFLLSLIFI